MAKKFSELEAEMLPESRARSEVEAAKMIAEMEQQEEQGIWQYGIGGAYIPPDITIVEPEEVYSTGYSEVDEGEEKEINGVEYFDIGGEG